MPWPTAGFPRVHCADHLYHATWRPARPQCWPWFAQLRPVYRTPGPLQNGHYTCYKMAATHTTKWPPLILQNGRHHTTKWLRLILQNGRHSYGKLAAIHTTNGRYSYNRMAAIHTENRLSLPASRINASLARCRARAAHRLHVGSPTPLRQPATPESTNWQHGFIWRQDICHRCPQIMK